MIFTGETEVIGEEKPVPLPLFPLHISRKQVWDRTRASVVRVRRINASEMARPEDWKILKFF